MTTKSLLPSVFKAGTIALICFALAFSFTACSKDDDPAPTLWVLPETLPEFTVAGGAKELTIFSNTTWSVSVTPATETWCTLSATSGDKDGTITVTAAANDLFSPRTAAITIKTTSGSADQIMTVTVTQAAAVPTLWVSPETLPEFTVAGGAKKLTIFSNTTWSASVTPATETWCTLSATSGDKDGTITVTAAEGALFSPRTGTITIRTTAGSPEQTKTIAVTQAVLPPPYAALFARSNIILKDGKLTFAVTAADNAAIPSDVQGVFFKFGSLVAVKSISTGVLNASDVVFSPSGYNITGIESWGDVPYCNYTGVTGMDVDALIAAYPATGYDVASGKGDICRYISVQGWVAGKWRTPKASELQALYNETTYKPHTYNGMCVGSWGTITTANADGTSRLTMGWFFGSGVNGSTSATHTPPANTVYFPASGLRYTAAAALSNVGSSGNYWSASPSSTSGYNLYFNGNGVNPSNSTIWGADGYPVRCIRE